ncbi:hypothetical protein QBC43DRAFT_40296 [Cladorrhinum sp. PSN259]|nr:hypothetical protein QBC43DRAFT_40296 [Cladorrhinum sp. PSN259]
MSAPTAIHGGTAPLASLTSVFTPPCPTTWVITTNRLLSQYPAFPTAGPSACNPPSWRANIAGQGFEYYSPAVCPQGFVVGPNCGLTKTRTEEGFPTVAPQETVAYCVPQGLTCTTDTTDYRGGVWGFALGATTYGASVTVGPAIQIRWREADLTKLETHPLTPGLRVTKTDMAVQAAVTAVIVSDTKSISFATNTPEPTDVLITDTTVPVQSSARFPGGVSTAQSAPSFATSSSSSSGGGDRMLGSLNRTNSIIVIVIITVVVAGMLAGGAFFWVRRYKRKQERPEESVEDGHRASTWPTPSHRGTYMSASSQQKTVRDVRSTTPASSRMLARDVRSTRPATSRMTARDVRSTTPGSKKVMTNLDPLAGVSELDGTPPASAVRPPHLGSTPNPAELEGDATQNTARSGTHSQRSWLRSPSLHNPMQSPRSVRSFGRRTVRESFGEKINDPATILGRLRIPSVRSTMSRQSPGSASPSALSPWRIPRSPRTPRTPMTNRLSQVSEHPPRVSSRKSGLDGDVVGTPAIAERAEQPDEENGGKSSSAQRGSRP